jgi:hypothetical protein
MKKILFLYLFLLTDSGILFSQSSTRNPSNNLAGEKQDGKTDVTEHKIMLIPFAPKMFMIEIGSNIKKETGMSFGQITEAFRNGLDFSLLMQTKPKYKVISLLADTSSTSKDIEYIYESIGYSYDLVPDTSTANKGIMASLKKKEEDKPVNRSGIKDGQIMVDVDNNRRFMNTTLSNPNLLPYLNKKYKTDVYVFINQLDIKNMLGDQYDINSDRYEREITIHYTVFDKSGKLLNSGISVDRFASNKNDPKKIVNDDIAEATRVISERIIKVLTPVQNPAVKQPVQNSPKKASKY